MSLIGTVANYGGRQPDNFSNTKQFVVGAGSQVSWIYKKLPNGLLVQTPADKKNAVYINSDLYVNGSIFNTSDKVLKDNIEPITENKKQQLLNLNPLEYTFKTDIHKKKHYGFIAQEIEQIYPELVKISDLGYKTVNYIELIPLIVSKMKDMECEINILKKENTELRCEIKELRDDIR